MQLFLEQYWPFILIAALAIAVIAFVALRSGQRVALTRDSDRPSPQPTLARTVTPEAIVEPIPNLPPLVIAEADGAADDLLAMKGVGPKLVAKLTELGVTRYAQIAAWQPQDIAAIDARLGPFAGRIGRDLWVEQARLLAAGDTTGFEARFGKLDRPI